MIAHEYANIYRMLNDEELNSLAEDIRQKGQLLPITIYEGKILDGRNRYRACEIAGVEPKTTEYTGNDPIGLIVSLNDHRRHDTANERAMVGARMANLRHGTNQHKVDSSMDESTTAALVSRKRASELSGASETNIDRAKVIINEGSPKLQELVEEGQVSIRAAAAIAKMPADEQREVIAAGPEAIKAKAKEIREKGKTPDPEPEPVVVEPQRSERLPKFVPDDADRLWLLARTDLDKILTSDKSRERVLKEIIQYAQQRIDTKK